MEIVSNSFHILRCRDFGTSISKEIAHYDLPPLYKIFYGLFDIRRRHFSSFDVKIGEEKCPIASLVYLPNIDDFTLYNLFSLEESKTALTYAFDGSMQIDQRKFWPIGDCGAGQFLLLGTDEINEDKIYLEDFNLFEDGSRIKLIAENIFEFVKGLVVVERNKPGYGIESYAQFYKNWGEDFWRIRPAEGGEIPQPNETKS